MSNKSYKKTKKNTLLNINRLIKLGYVDAKEATHIITTGLICDAKLGNVRKYILETFNIKYKTIGCKMYVWKADIDKVEKLVSEFMGNHMSRKQYLEEMGGETCIKKLTTYEMICSLYGRQLKK